MKVRGLLLGALLVAQLPAQTGLRGFDRLYHIGGEANKDNFGKSVCSVGDINGDHMDDFLVGADFAEGGGLDDSGSVFMYSGLDGSLVYRLDGASNGDKFGGDISATDDVDGDGVKDFIVGARFADAAVAKDAGLAFLYSGATGVELMRFQGQTLNGFFGISVAGVGDTNLDGAPDFLIGSRGKVSSSGNLPGNAWLYSGADSSLIRHTVGPISGDLFGDEVSALGDINGDGAADYMVGAPGVHSVYIYSGLDGTEIQLLDDFTGTSDAGTALSPISDLTGDGLPDILVGDPASRTVHIFESGNFNKIGELIQSSTYVEFGASVAPAGDIDQDGREDIFIGAQSASPTGTQTGSAFIYSSATGALLKRFDGDTSLGKFGCSVFPVGDLNRDGLPDVIIGSRLGDFEAISQPGYIEAYITKHYMALETDGQAPGAIQIVAKYAENLEVIAFFYGQPGTSNVPIPDCGTVQVDLSAPKLDRIHQAGPTGRVNFTIVIPAALVGWAIQGVNLTTCETTNVVQI
jgi:hypothetical protein